MDLQNNPHFLLGQLVATSFLLRQEIKRFKPLYQENTAKKPYNSDFIGNLDPHQACYKLMEQELIPYKELLEETKHHYLLEDLNHIYNLKAKYDFIEEELDENLYQQGYESQLDKYRKDSCQDE